MIRRLFQRLTTKFHLQKKPPKSQTTPVKIIKIDPNNSKHLGVVNATKEYVYMLQGPVSVDWRYNVPAGSSSALSLLPESSGEVYKFVPPLQYEFGKWTSYPPSRDQYERLRQQNIHSNYLHKLTQLEEEKVKLRKQRPGEWLYKNPRDHLN